MHVYFWGTRGSLPASTTTQAIQEKIFKAIRMARAHPLQTDESIAAFIQKELPFPVSLKDMKANIVFHTLEPGKTYDIAGLSVKGIKQNHPGYSYGYRFSKAGKKIVYSTDAEHKREAGEEGYYFLDFFEDADLLIFDAQYTLADAIGVKENWGHSNNLVAVELSISARAKRLCLFHSEHTYNDETLDRFLDDTRKYLKYHADAYPLQIDLAYDGLEIEV